MQQREPDVCSGSRTVCPPRCGHVVPTVPAARAVFVPCTHSNQGTTCSLCTAPSSLAASSMLLRPCSSRGQRVVGTGGPSAAALAGNSRSHRRSQSLWPGVWLSPRGRRAEMHHDARYSLSSGTACTPTLTRASLHSASCFFFFSFPSQP